MSSKLDEIKEKLRKLIAKEESSRELGNQMEAEAFASKIQELLLQYELDIEEVRGKDKASDIEKEKVDITDIVGSHEGTWVYLLYGVGAENNFCKVVMPYKWDYNYLTLIGEENNREFTHYFVNQLISKLRELARRSFKEYRGTDKRNTYIRAFLRGAVDGIKSRLQKDRKEAMDSTPQVYGLVVRKDAALRIFMDQAYRPGSLGSRSNTSTSSQAGYLNGVAAGQGVSINKGVSSRGMGGTKLLG
jgi:hypothetical protein